jgi:hypothetical protein
MSNLLWALSQQQAKNNSNQTQKKGCCRARNVTVFKAGKLLSTPWTQNVVAHKGTVKSG